ncbi:uncharacterized protein [Thunnus thynnus]|uniref:uncharacterized protein n=1 Tax=Thunnus thynnus TaxID=8237 RepID=UPI0035299F76
MKCSVECEVVWMSGSREIRKQQHQRPTASERHFSPGSPEETPLHKMLFLPAAALCCLCSALVAMAEELIQEDLTLTKKAGEKVSFRSEYRSTSTDYNILTAQVLPPQAPPHSAIEQVVKPVVSVYPAAHLEGKSSLLCLASAMSPPLVQFSWKRQKKNGPLEDLPPAEGEQLELRERERTVAIRVVDRDALYTYKYHCYVKHKGGTVRAQTEQEVFALPPPTPAPPASPTPAPSASPTPAPSAEPPAAPPAGFVPSQYQVKLLCVLYTVLIVKSLVYCCGLCLLMILRNKGPSTNCTHAD